jgi:hypothetical protein
MVVGVQAIDARAQDVSWGIKGGAVFASINVTGPGAFETSADAGPTLGGFVAVDLGRGVRIQPELLWVASRFSASDVPFPFTVTSRSFEVPLLAQVRFPSGGRTQALVFAGPQFSFIGAVHSRGQERVDLSAEIRNHDLGIAFGGGVQRALTKGAIDVEIRMSMGSRNLYERGEGTLKARAVMALLGYRF